jgi:hypothetical protein
MVSPGCRWNKRDAPLVLLLRIIKNAGRISFADIRNSCLTFLKGMPTGMNGISAQYKIVGMLDR